MQRLFAITLDPSIEDAFAATLDAPARHGVHHVSPTLKRALVEQLRETLPDRVWLSKSVVLMVNPEIRLLMRRTLKESFPRLTVLSTAEITADTQVESIAILEFPQSDLVATRSLRAV